MYSVCIHTNNHPLTKQDNLSKVETTMKNKDQSCSKMSKALGNFFKVKHLEHQKYEYVLLCYDIINTTFV